MIKWNVVATVDASIWLAKTLEIETTRANAEKLFWKVDMMKTG